MRLITIDDGQIQLSLDPDDARALARAVGLGAQATMDDNDYRHFSSLAAMFAAAAVASQAQADFGYEEPAAAD